MNEKQYQLTTGEVLTENQLKFWYDREDLADTIPIHYESLETLRDTVSGILIVYNRVRNTYDEEYRLNPRTIEAIESAKDIYYRHFVLDSLVTKNSNLIKIGKLKAKRIKSDRRKLLRGINR